MMKFLKLSIIVGLLVLSLGAQARTERNSFLNKPAPTQKALLDQVRHDKVVADRFMRHFSMTQNEVLDFFSTLRVTPLPAEGVYAVYNVPDSGVLRARYFRLRKGTKVWVDLANKPVLKESCGNPMTLGPNARADQDPVTLIDITADPKATVEQEDEVLIKYEPLQPSIPKLELEQPIVVTTVPPDVVTEAGMPEVFSSKATIPPFLALVPPVLAGLVPPPRHSPPPVPEPASILALATGVLGLAARRLKRK